MANPLRPLHARVSDTAREGWEAAAALHDVSVTALIEAIGERFYYQPAETTADGGRLFDRAREIHAARRSREPDRQDPPAHPW